MPITDATYTGMWKLSDFHALLITRQQEAGELKNPDGSPQIVTRYLASAQLTGADQPIEARAIVPAKIWRKVRKLLAPYVAAEAVKAFKGTTKAVDVGAPNPGDED